MPRPATRKGAKTVAAKPPAAARPRTARAQQAQAIRERLFEAAADVVGRVGYAEASITLITQKAGVAQGTFYNYFASRQDLLDRLLPALGEHMLAHVARCAAGGTNFVEIEERAFRGFFSFLRETPAFLRILNEAESYAPKGYKRHFDHVTKVYVKFLRRSLANGEFPGYADRDLEPVVFMLMAARSYLAMRYIGKSRRKTLIPESVVATYMKCVRFGLQGHAAPVKRATGVRPKARGVT